MHTHTHTHMHTHTHTHTHILKHPSDADITYVDHDKDQMAALDTLAAHYVQLARNEKSKDLRKEHFAQVSDLSFYRCDVVGDKSEH